MIPKGHIVTLFLFQNAYPSHCKYNEKNRNEVRKGMWKEERRKNTAVKWVRRKKVIKQYDCRDLAIH
jgi:hypothetical protein